MRVAMVEADTAWEDAARNRAAIPPLLPPGADLAVLPELAFSGFTMAPRPDPQAEPFLASLARERGLHLIAGYCGEGPRNMAVAVGRDGAVLARYAKLHPFSLVGEEKRYLAGNDLPVFDLLGVKVCMLICYDLRFPEVFREAARRGAELFVVIANWPKRRVAHWGTLLTARAIENQAFVVGVNRVGRDPNEEYESSSLAVDPLGETISRGPGTVEIDIDHARRWRRDFPALRDVRR